MASQQCRATASESLSVALTGSNFPCTRHTTCIASHLRNDYGPEPTLSCISKFLLSHPDNCRRLRLSTDSSRCCSSDTLSLSSPPPGGRLPPQPPSIFHPCSGHDDVGPGRGAPHRTKGRHRRTTGTRCREKVIGGATWPLGRAGCFSVVCRGPRQGTAPDHPGLAAAASGSHRL